MQLIESVDAHGNKYAPAGIQRGLLAVPLHRMGDVLPLCDASCDDALPARLRPGH